jgi:hypothetical protein
LPSSGYDEQALSLLTSIANLGLKALNVMHGTFCEASCQVATLAQTSVQAIASWKVLRMRLRLTTVDFVFNPSASLGTLVGDSMDLTGVKASSGEEAFNADAFDLLQSSGTVDPMQCLDPLTRNCIIERPGIFPRSAMGLEKFPGVRRADKDEYAKLVALQLRSRKVELVDSVLAGGSVFAVGKKGSAKMREVWDGSRISLASQRPPKPPQLASPTAFLDLEATRSRPYFLSKRDGKCLFDQLLAPEQIRNHFGRPPVLVRDLVRCGGMTLSEIRKCYCGSGRLGLDSKLFPRSRVWPMGFSWSSFIAQSTMLRVCASAGLTRFSMLAADLDTPSDVSEAFSLATDDVIHFATNPRKSIARMQRLDEAFALHGVEQHRGKNIDQAQSGTALGIELDNGLFLAPDSVALIRLLSAIIHLVSSLDNPNVTPLEVASLLGVAQWFCLLNRPLLSVFTTSTVLHVSSRAHSVSCCLPVSRQNWQ